MEAIVAVTQLSGCIARKTFCCKCMANSVNIEIDGFFTY